MKPNSGFDDKFQPKGQRWFSSVRSTGRLTMIVTACTLFLAVTLGVGKHKRNRCSVPLVVQPIFQVPQVNATGPQATDPFLVTARAEIDVEMVVRAPKGIDEALVVNPYTRGGQSARKAAAQGNHLIPLPGDQSGLVPDYAYPPELLPPSPVAPR